MDVTREQHDAKWFIAWILKAPFIAFYIAVGVLFVGTFLWSAFRTLWRIAYYTGISKRRPPIAERAYGAGNRARAALQVVGVVITVMALAGLSESGIRGSRVAALAIATVGILALVDLFSPPR